MTMTVEDRVPRARDTRGLVLTPGALATRRHRERHPTAAQRNIDLSKARERAQRRLAAEQPDRLQELYAEECQAAGIAPPRGYRTRGRPD